MILTCTQDTQTRQNVHQKTRKLTIAIEPSGDYENNNRVGLAKFHSIDDYGDGIIGCPSPVYSPHSDKYASNRLGSSKKNSREERNQKSKSSGRPPFSAIVPAIESPTEETSTVKNDPIKGEISPIPPPPPYRRVICAPCIIRKVKLNPTYGSERAIMLSRN